MSTDPIYSFEIARPLLQAMALFQSTDETRLILASTKFEIRASNGHYELTLISCDGRRLAVHQNEILSDNLLSELPASTEFSIDLAGVKKLPKSKANPMATISVFQKHAEITCGKFKYKADFITEAPDGPNQLQQFPNWRQIVPQGDPVPIAKFPVNFDLLASFGAAAKLLTKDRAGIVASSFGENSPIAIALTGYREFWGVLMPIATEQTAETPEWLKDTVTTKAEEAIAV